MCVYACTYLGIYVFKYVGMYVYVLTSRFLHFQANLLQGKYEFPAMHIYVHACMHICLWMCIYSTRVFNL